ncbi:MAG: class D beta-lactamase [Melioribacteraceae bacterium]|jgi:beta-lactamase class D|nr:class D beta-lactamase [Melioribacteraceae bacterium]
MIGKKVLILLCVFNLAVIAEKHDSTFVKKLFEDTDATMLICDQDGSAVFLYNEERSKQRYVPASTFKIPNSIIAIETKVLADTNQIIKWDGIKRDMLEWNRDHNLSSALKYSVVPFYQEFARQVGAKKYMEYLTSMNYGNKVIGNRVDYFWLDNSLQISAIEQIDFLRKLLHHQLPFEKKNIEIVKNIMSIRKYGESSIKFKTGTGKLNDTSYVAWLVGFVAHENKTYLFAFNCSGKSFAEVSDLRNRLPYSVIEKIIIGI